MSWYSINRILTPNPSFSFSANSSLFLTASFFSPILSLCLSVRSRRFLQSFFYPSFIYSLSSLQKISSWIAQSYFQVPLICCCCHFGSDLPLAKPAPLAQWVSLELWIILMSCDLLFCFDSLYGGIIIWIFLQYTFWFSLIWITVFLFFFSPPPSSCVLRLSFLGFFSSHPKPELGSAITLGSQILYFKVN